MKHYLDLIPISAKTHQKQSKMTRLCIVFSVFLVTVIFSMADMEIRTQKIQVSQQEGSWHAGFQGIDEEAGALIAARPKIKEAAWYGVLNFQLEEAYQINGTKLMICGFDEELLNMVPYQNIVEGKFPEAADEAVFTLGAKKRLGVKTGDFVTVDMPDGGVISYRVSGFTEDTSTTDKHDAYAVFLNMEGYQRIIKAAGGTNTADLFVQFESFCNIQKEIEDICRQFQLKDSDVARNEKLLMMMLQSEHSYAKMLYKVALALTVLVTAAGIFMIAASLNSNIAGRTEFFGMLRCLGATKKQVIRFVRREALNWCKVAVPLGVAGAVIVTWICCAILRFASPGVFEKMPVFGISVPGILAGILIGVITVFLAASSPAKRAAKASPLAAVSGNAGTVQAVKRAANTNLFKVETALGIHHAVGSRKNLFLVTGSFAFSILLFLAFSTSIDFMHHAVNALRPDAPDVCVTSPDSVNTLNAENLTEIEEIDAVKRVFGRRYKQLNVQIDGHEETISLLSYGTYQFEQAERMLVEGTLKDAEEGKSVLAVYGEGEKKNTVEKITLPSEDGETELKVSGILENFPYAFGTEGKTFVCSEELFEMLTGECGYAVIDVQFHAAVSDEVVEKIRQIAGEGAVFSDRRASNEETKGVYYSFALFLYGFLLIIGLISAFSIVNMISMSVSARMKDYGVMRAVGMSEKQVIRMIISETVSYSALGILTGSLFGLFINQKLFEMLVTSRWGDTWQLPLEELLIMILVILTAVCAAVRGPAKQIRKMSITDTINAQ